ncbi:MAG: polyprenyl synthetase family protein [Dongiaceae bacterium]
MSTLQDSLSKIAAHVTEAMDSLIPHADGAEGKLYEAMRYAATGGGKRMRPFLVMNSAALFGVNESAALRVAAAVEFTHAYSLIHDDLPAMDNSYLRRGRPTTHIKFGEALAILAGDALQALAYTVLSDPDIHPDPMVRASLMQRLAHAAGGRGMVGGQTIDLFSASRDMDVNEVVRMQRLKTGELFAFSCESGAILGKTQGRARQSLQAYAYDLGVAFQITDDILDAKGSTAETGKSVGLDKAANKPNFVSLLGMERARMQAEILSNQAVKHLDMFDERADPMRELARYAIDRKL